MVFKDVQIGDYFEAHGWGFIKIRDCSIVDEDDCVNEPIEANSIIVGVNKDKEFEYLYKTDWCPPDLPVSCTGKVTHIK